MPQADTITLRSSHGRLLDPAFPLVFAAQNPGYFLVKRNKRGNITALRLKPRMSLAALTNAGMGFKQHLECGSVIFALKGTPGAMPAPVVG